MIPIRNESKCPPKISIFMAMAKLKSTGEYLWATELWHKRLVEESYDRARPGFVTRLLSLGGGGGGGPSSPGPASLENERGGG